MLGRCILPCWVFTLVIVSVRLSLSLSTQLSPAEQSFLQWVLDKGGEFNVEIATDEKGLRGLYATRTIRKDELIFSVPGSVIMNLGSAGETFSVPIFNYLRELKNPTSRFKPYMDTLPKLNEMVDWYSAPAEYLAMLQDEELEKQITEYQLNLHHLHKGEYNDMLEITALEAVGDAPLSFDDLAYAALVTSTRYLSTEPRDRLLMVPIFDLANHRTGCPHYTEYRNSLFLTMRAGEDIMEGDEVCSFYGELRLDESLLRYGYVLPDEPPALAAIDHYAFNGSHVPYHDVFPEDSSAEAIQEEIARLLVRLDRLKTVQNPGVITGHERMHALLLEYQHKRAQALRLEIRRLQAILGIETQREEL